jgi:adenosylmethionine-8-amino-7-oxononanoate aminotransferase
MQRIANKHQTFIPMLQTFEKAKKVRNIRTIGVILAFEIETQQETSYINEARSSLYDYFLAKNILLRPLGNVIYILPPYCITDQELELVYAVIIEYLQQ